MMWMCEHVASASWLCLAESITVNIYFGGSRISCLVGCWNHSLRDVSDVSHWDSMQDGKLAAGKTFCARARHNNRQRHYLCLNDHYAKLCKSLGACSCDSLTSSPKTLERIWCEQEDGPVASLFSVCLLICFWKSIWGQGAHRAGFGVLSSSKFNHFDGRSRPLSTDMRSKRDWEQLRRQKPADGAETSLLNFVDMFFDVFWPVGQEHSGQNALHVRRGRKILMSGTRWSTHVAKPQVFANCLTSQIVDNWIQDALHECQHDDHSTLVSHAGSCQRHEPHLAVASPAMVERRRVQFKPRVSLVLVVPCSTWLSWCLVSHLDVNVYHQMSHPSFAGMRGQENRAGSLLQ